MIQKSKTLCLVTCVSFAASIFAAQAHRAVVVHGYCSDHGAVIHLSWNAAHLPRKTARKPGLSGHQHVTGVHGCLAQSFLLSSWAPARFHLVEPVAQEASFVGSTSHDVEPSLIPLLHQAPKHSPPRA